MFQQLARILSGHQAPAASPIQRPCFTSARLERPFIALTFDDGPHPLHTPRLLASLAAHRVRATFFVIGENAQAHPGILKRAVAEGHEIGNHSWSHPNFTVTPDETVHTELRRTACLIQSTTGIAPRLVRPPFGESTRSQRQWVRETLQNELVRWSVDPRDWMQPGGAAIRQRVVEGACSGSIILLHDVQPQTVEAVPAIIGELLARGFQFVTASELIALHQPPPCIESLSS